jgi:hypothetical protein
MLGYLMAVALGPAQAQPEVEPAPEGAPEEASEEASEEKSEPDADSEPAVEPPEETQTPDPEPVEHESETKPDLEARLDALESRVTELERENQELRQTHRDEVDRLSPISGRVGGYVDVGAFWAAGNGVGFRPDFGNQNFPELDEIPGSWVFMGDPLSTMVNSRGEAADLSGSRALRFDSLDSGGGFSFTANALNLRLDATLGDQFAVEGLVDFVPRTRDVATDGVALGDFIDVKLASVRWMAPTKAIDLDVYVGKIDSVVGQEYQTQESPQRLTVTPSLACRYTCGRAVGMSMRFGFFQRALQLNLAATNGGNTVEHFGFHGELDQNDFKTLSGRMAFRIPVDVVTLRFAASGSFGAQDLQPRNDNYQWLYGFDFSFEWRDLALVWEVVSADANGQTTEGGVSCDVHPCLDSLSTYGMASYRVLAWLVPYFRAEYRDATHWQGTQFAYLTEAIRLTPGVNFPVTQHVTVKAEYVVNLERGRVPTFANDVFTSSVVGYF